MNPLKRLLQPLPQGWEKDFTVGKEVITTEANQLVPSGIIGTITHIETGYDQHGRPKPEDQLGTEFSKGRVIEVSFDFPIPVYLGVDLLKRLSIQPSQFYVKKGMYSPNNLLICNASLVEETFIKDGNSSQVLKDGIIHIYKSGGFCILNNRKHTVFKWMNDNNPEALKEMAFTLALVRSIGARQFENLLALRPKR